MSGKKLNQLFQAARHAAPPPLPGNLAEEVVRALRGEPPRGPAPAATLFEELNAGFARLAVVTVIILALGVAANLALGTPEITDLGDGLAQISAQWLLLPEGL